MTERDPTVRPEDCLAGGGEMGALMRAHDWRATPFGPVARWPQSLRTAVSMLLESRFAMVVAWGPDFRFFYNDRYRPVLGNKHPASLGAACREIFPEVWPQIGPAFEGVREGRSFAIDDWLLPLERSGYLENCWFSVSYSPIRDETGSIGGLLAVVAETTRRVEGERRLATLRDLARNASDAKSAEDACTSAGAVLERNPIDVPFAIFYLLAADGRSARRACSVGLPADHLANPEWLELGGPEGDDKGWPIARVAATGRGEDLADLPQRFGALPGGPYEQPTHTAVVLPLSRPGLEHPYGVLVAGVSPRRALDSPYRDFYDLAAEHVVAAVANARAFEEAKQRAEALAELDRAKTAFFSNISHEFRTPLTLMLGPLDEMLSPGRELPPGDADALGLVRRNGRRLLKLVNTLLEFSRIEAGRVEASYEPTDLAALTADLASVFRSAIDKAGLRLVVDCPALPEPVFVDREMWERIVVNLLSNAFKYTWHGEIQVRLRAAGGAALLEVEDTGTGISEDELPRVFDRFHRIRGAQGRTHEGTGIGLALVLELVKLHGGTITARSLPGQGSTFSASLPFGREHLPPERIAKGSATRSGRTATVFAEEARLWLGDGASGALPEALAEVPAAGPAPPRGLVLIADDNADMRAYVGRLLAERHEVVQAADGEEALRLARARIPDVVVADVMMPRRDGFSLLRALKDEPQTRAVPVVLLSARAGDEARLEGLRAGADDYMVKPFSARELLARVEARIEIARLRADGEHALREESATLERLNEVGKGVAAELDLDRVVQLVTDASTELTGAAFGSFFYNVKGAGKESYWLYTLSGASRDAFAGMPMPRNTALFGPTFHGDAPVRCDDVLADPRYGKSPPHHGMPKGHLPVRSYLAVPVVSRSGEVIGGLFFGHPGVGVFTERAERLAVGIAAQAAIAIDNARLYQAAQKEIAERDRVQTALRESEARFRHLADNAPVLIWLNDLEGCEFVNQEYLRFTGGTFDDVRGSNWTTLVHPDDLASYSEAYRVACDERHPYEAQCRMRRRDGQYRWLHTRGIPRLDPSGQLLGFMGCSVDVSDIKASEEALREADRRKDEFLSTLSHELRSPLNAIVGWTHILQGGNNDDATTSRALEAIHRNAMAQNQLVADILDLQGLTSGKLRLTLGQVDLALVIEAALDTVRPAAISKEIALVPVLDSNGGPVWGDPDRLQQIVWNLLSNAVKFTPRHGRVQVGLSRVGSLLEVFVSDTGPGVDPPFLPYVFDRFRQADASSTRRHGGLGLGLAIARRLTELHGGTIEAANRPSGGAVFTVRLPILSVAPVPAVRGADRKAVRTVEDGLPAAAPRLHGLKVLVVDDDVDAREVVASVLARHGADVLTAASGEEVIPLIQGHRPDVLVCDIEMPSEDGYSVIRRVRKLSSSDGGRIPAAALTAYAGTEDRMRALSAGFQMHVPKPVQPDELVIIVASLAANRL